MHIEYINKKAFLHAGTLCVCLHIVVTNFWNPTRKKKRFYVPKFQTLEGFFHGLSVAVFRNILLFSFFKCGK